MSGCFVKYYVLIRTCLNTYNSYKSVKLNIFTGSISQQLLDLRYIEKTTEGKTQTKVVFI